jgi:hypothetical protein
MRTNINPKTGKGLKYIDRVGTRNGRLLFLEDLGIDKHKQYRWRALCDCGNVTVTTSPKSTKSCGCIQREKSAERQRAKRLPPEIKEISRKRNAANQRLKRKTDPIKSMHARLSRLHRHALSQVSAIKTSPTFEALGYSVKDFVKHIERQFTDGMGWHNSSEWQIDHIVPISEAKTEADVVALNQLSNLRPIWAKDNNAKKAKRETLL